MKSRWVKHGGGKLTNLPKAYRCFRLESGGDDVVGDEAEGNSEAGHLVVAGQVDQDQGKKLESPLD